MVVLKKSGAKIWLIPRLFRNSVAQGTTRSWHLSHAAPDRVAVAQMHLAARGISLSMTTGGVTAASCPRSDFALRTSTQNGGQA